MSQLIVLSNVRLSFPHLVEPQRSINQQTGKERLSYNCELLMPADHPGFQQFMRRYGELALAEVKEHSKAVMEMIQQDRKSRCFGRGEEKVNKKTFQPYDGYAGHVYLTVGNQQPPQMIDSEARAIDSSNLLAYQNEARKLYAGCRVNVAIKPWWQKANPEKQYGHGIRCDLISIQFAANDTPFGEGVIDGSGLFSPVSVASTVEGFAPVSSQPPMPAAPFPAVAPQVPASLPAYLLGSR